MMQKGGNHRHTRSCPAVQLCLSELCVCLRCDGRVLAARGVQKDKKKLENKTDDGKKHWRWLEKEKNRPVLVDDLRCRNGTCPANA